MTVKIGFIGLGNMGAPMARNLKKSGYDVTGFDIQAPCPTELVAASSVEEAATRKDIVVTMLPNGAALQAVTHDILPIMSSGSLLLDCSTVEIDHARQAAEDSYAKSIEFVDAPVSGGVVGAEAGTLTFMAGGRPSAFARARPLFDILGGRAVHCGDTPGSGQAAKICNNMILGATMIVTCEAFALADQLGLDRQKMFDVVSTSSGYSWSLNAYCPAEGVGPESPADHNYKPGFAADLMLKDLRLAQMAVASTDLSTPMGQLATEIYADFVENKSGSGLDFSGIMKMLKANRP